jgi:hypothetical protein
MRNAVFAVPPQLTKKLQRDLFERLAVTLYQRKTYAYSRNDLKLTALNLPVTKEILVVIPHHPRHVPNTVPHAPPTPYTFAVHEKQYRRGYPKVDG